MAYEFHNFESDRLSRLVEGLEWGKFRGNLFNVPLLRVIHTAKHDHISGLTLEANSYHGRLRWHRSFLQKIAGHLGDPLDGSGHQGEAHFFTLIDSRECCQQPYEVPPLSHLRFHYGVPLSGWNFVGMLEPALFVSLPLQMSRSGLLFCWHVHGVAWGLRRQDVETARRIARARGFRVLVPRAKVLDVAPIVPGELVRAVGYLNKSPRHQISLSPRGDEGKKLYDRDATGANLARLHRHLSGLYLDDMAVAGGEGVELLKMIKSDALRGWREHKRDPGPRPGLALQSNPGRYGGTRSAL